VTDQLFRVVLAIDQAVSALRQEVGAAAFMAALDQAHAAVRQLSPGLSEQALSALLCEIEECRRRGDRDSSCLQMHIQFAAVAVVTAQAKGRRHSRFDPDVSSDD
jgi:hypothetical protein